MKSSKAILQKLIELIKESGDDVPKEAFLEDLLSNIKEPIIESIWDDLSTIQSYFIVLVNSLAVPLEASLVKEVLLWQAFSGRGTATVKCFASSDNNIFNLCHRKFPSIQPPIVIVSNLPTFEHFYLIEPQQVEWMLAENNRINRVLNRINQLIINDGGVHTLDQVFAAPEFQHKTTSISKLKELIGKAQFPLVFQRLGRHPSLQGNQEYDRLFFSLKSEYSRYEERKLLYDIPQHDLAQMVNSLTDRLLSLIQKLEGD